MSYPNYTRALRARWAARFGHKTPKDRWQPEEDERATEMRQRGKTYGQIALRVHRTPDAVASRLRYLRAREDAG